MQRTGSSRRRSCTQTVQISFTLPCVLFPLLDREGTVLDRLLTTRAGSHPQKPVATSDQPFLVTALPCAGLPFGIGPHIAIVAKHWEVFMVSSSSRWGLRFLSAGFTCQLIPSCDRYVHQQCFGSICVPHWCIPSHTYILRVTACECRGPLYISTLWSWDQVELVTSSQLLSCLGTHYLCQVIAYPAHHSSSVVHLMNSLGLQVVSTCFSMACVNWMMTTARASQ